MKIRASVCAECEKKEEAQFQELRAYIEEEPLSNISELSEATGVPAKRILRYIREGRLQVSEGLMGSLRCSKCGEPVIEGNFCSTCSEKMAQKLAGALDKQTPSTKKGSGFHTR